MTRLNQALTRETQGKVMALLGSALLSLAFMLGVSLTDASLSGVQGALYDPFGPETVVAVIDSAAAGYSQFLTANFIQPLAQQYQMYGDNLAWVANESGLSGVLGFGEEAAPGATARVAGASTIRYLPKGSFSVDTLYSMLIQ